MSSPRLLLLMMLTATIAEAQDRPAGNYGRPWLSFGIGGGSTRYVCRTCEWVVKSGGPSLTISTGVSLPKRLGIAVSYWKHFTLSFDGSTGRARHRAVLVQYSPLSPVTMNVGLGKGVYDGWPFKSNAREWSDITAFGLALRLPPRSVAALSLSAMYLQSARWILVDQGSLGTRMMRPRTLHIIGSLSLAGQVKK
jgi:hypothetical protein